MLPKRKLRRKFVKVVRQNRLSTFHDQMNHMNFLFISFLKIKGNINRYLLNPHEKSNVIFNLLLVPHSKSLVSGYLLQINTRCSLNIELLLQ